MKRKPQPAAPALDPLSGDPIRAILAEAYLSALLRNADKLIDAQMRITAALDLILASTPNTKPRK